ncbi:DUF4198 domain-containing protein [Henriciella sp. AS95]|uniref:DUF4198 domain-containing protein n=1 Tax=Henriciella sp. AS95 TaxID=3135782 RepID=UPI0031734DA8
MRTLTGVLLAGAAAIAPAASAHDFWLEPESYWLDEETSVAVDIFTGHGEDKAHWPAAPHRIVGFRSFGPGGVTSQMAGAETFAEKPVVQLTDPGLHMLVLESTNAFSELPADKFTSYVEEEGILPIAADRAANRLDEAAGRELYSRRGKALIQRGCAADAEPIWAQPLGLTLEVVAVDNPFAWDEGEAFEVEVQFYGETVPSATLHVTNLDGAGEDFTTKTDEDGRADLGGSLSEGRWLVHTVWSEPVDGLLNEADYQTVFSSFTFETETGCE